MKYLLITLAIFICSCSSSRYTPTDDGLYHCHSDGKYYNTYTKENCK